MDDNSTSGSEVVLMCGVVGSGKTTYAQLLEAKGYVRLSIDEEVWKRSGRYGIDYPADEYATLSAIAEEAIRRRLLTLVSQHQNVVLDLSFWKRGDRDRYKKLIVDAGGDWRLIYLEVDPEELRRRLRIRSKRFDANAAFPITADQLAKYLACFEAPHGEGEEVVK